MVYPKPGFVICISYKKSPPKTAVAVAVVPTPTPILGGAEIETVGADAYPEPTLVIVIPLTVPEETVAVADAFTKSIWSLELIDKLISTLFSSYSNNPALSI